MFSNGVGNNSISNLFIMLKSLYDTQYYINSTSDKCVDLISNLVGQIENEMQRNLINGINHPTESAINKSCANPQIHLKNICNQDKESKDENIMMQEMSKEVLNKKESFVYDEINKIVEKKLLNVDDTSRQIFLNSNSTPLNECENIMNIDSNNITNLEILKNKEQLTTTYNTSLKKKFLELKEKSNKRYFQVVYIFKKKIKRMYRIDCMTRKINVNFYHFLKENQLKLDINDELLNFFKNNIRFTSRNKFQDFEKKYPDFKKIYDNYLKSDKFKNLIMMIKMKYDEEYLKLFFRHSKNFLCFYLKDSSHAKLGRKYGSKNLKKK